MSSGVARGKALGLTASDIGKVEDINVRRCSGKAFTALAGVVVQLCLFNGRHLHRRVVRLHGETTHIIRCPARKHEGNGATNHSTCRSLRAAADGGSKRGAACSRVQRVQGRVMMTARRGEEPKSPNVKLE